MKPFSKILVPIDFLSHSADAVRLASELALANDADVLLVHVYEPAVYPASPGSIAYTPEQLRRMTKSVRARLEAVRRELDPRARQRFSVQVVQGSPASRIIELARRERADLIVMGTHGRTGLERLILGSVAEDVMRRAPCAVLTVKSQLQPPVRVTREVTEARAPLEPAPSLSYVHRVEREEEIHVASAGHLHPVV